VRMKALAYLTPAFIRSLLCALKTRFVNSGDEGWLAYLARKTKGPHPESK